MKSAIAILATVFAVSAFAQAPAKKEEVKPAAPAATASAPAPAKKEEAKPAAKPADKKAEPVKSEPAKK